MENEHRFVVRLPKDLFEQLKDIAAGENRSLNGQIVNILKETVEAYKQAGLVK